MIRPPRFSARHLAGRPGRRHAQLARPDERCKADELRRAAWPASCCGCKAVPASSRPSAPSRATPTAARPRPITTAVAGIEIAENLPHVAKAMQDVAIIRSMTSKEGSHPRATYLMHTGYLPTASVKYPTLGSIVAQQIGDAPSSSCRLRAHRRPRLAELPAAAASWASTSIRSSCRAPAARPRTPQPATGVDRYNRRLDLLEPAGERVRRRAAASTRSPTIRSCIARRQRDDPQPADEGLRPRPRAGRRCATAYGTEPVRRGLPAGPAAGRDGRDVRRGVVSAAGTRTTTTSPRSSGWPARSTSRSPSCSPT